MKKTLAIAALAATAVLAVPVGANAAARPTWASSGLTGVQASGSYSRTGDSVHFYGTLYDTSDDNKAVRLLVRFSGECCAHVIQDSKGPSSNVPVDLSSTQAAHLDVKEEKGGGLSVWTEGPWVRIY